MAVETGELNRRRHRPTESPCHWQPSLPIGSQRPRRRASSTSRGHTPRGSVASVSRLPRPMQGDGPSAQPSSRSVQAPACPTRRVVLPRLSVTQAQWTRRPHVRHWHLQMGNSRDTRRQTPYRPPSTPTSSSSISEPSSRYTSSASRWLKPGRTG